MPLDKRHFRLYICSASNKSQKAMKVLYNNLYTHFVFTTKDRLLTIEECYRQRIEEDFEENKG